MSSPVIALRRAVRAALLADATLVAALGGPHVYDEAPPGAEQIVTLTVWSSERGVREALEIADRIVTLLDEAPLAPAGHRLVDLRFMQIATRREQNGRLARADLRFRATTEQN